MLLAFFFFLFFPSSHTHFKPSQCIFRNGEHWLVNMGTLRDCCSRRPEGTLGNWIPAPAAGSAVLWTSSDCLFVWKSKEPPPPCHSVPQYTLDINIWKQVLLNLNMPYPLAILCIKWDIPLHALDYGKDSMKCTWWLYYQRYIIA